MGFCIKYTICNVVETEKSKEEHIGTGSRGSQKQQDTLPGYSIVL